MSEEIRKSFSGGPIKADAAADIDLINRYTLRELKPEEVFAFSVNLCDDQPDRDFERFDVRSLRKLATMFPGKPLIQDHEWSAKNQQGRIYRAQVVQDWNVNRLRASVYMVRTPGTEETIKQIEGGVLKEVSVGFDIKKMTCSICGKPMIRSWRSAKCENEHEKGKEYSGQTCLGIMEDPSDAFEVSFVAVPSQPEAGVTKGRKAGQKISPEELPWRKEILLENEKVLSSFQNADSKPKHYPDIIPLDHGCYDDVKYALIPDSIIPQDVKVDVLKALGFCRKELHSAPISVRWFSPVSYVRRLGLDPSSLKTFSHEKTLRGLASRQNPTQILLRYPLVDPDYRADRTKTVFHECFHTLQYRDDCNPADEESAYEYMEDAYKRYLALSDTQREELYYGELLMKDYSKK